MKVINVSDEAHKLLQEESAKRDLSMSKLASKVLLNGLVEKPSVETQPETSPLLELVNTVLERDFRVLPHGSKKLLETFTLDEIGKALENLKQDEWHASRYHELKLDYLLRATTIDKFRSIEAPKGTRQRLNLNTGKMEDF